VVYKREEDEEEGKEEERQLRHKICGPLNEAALFHELNPATA
jgi:hypothetical protein